MPGHKSVCEHSAVQFEILNETFMRDIRDVAAGEELQVTGGVSAAMPRGGAASGDGGPVVSPPTGSASQDSAGARQSIRESGRENERRVNLSRRAAFLGVLCVPCGVPGSVLLAS